MGITTPEKAHRRPVLRTVQQRARHFRGFSSTPSEQAFESNTRDAYFWRR